MEFDSPSNNPQAGTGGDCQFEECSHGGGFNGASHEVMDIHDWMIAPDPTMGGLPTFFASWTETDSFKGQSQTYEVADQGTGIPAISDHRSQLLQFFGQPLPSGSSINVQVSWKPAH